MDQADQCTGAGSGQRRPHLGTEVAPPSAVPFRDLPRPGSAPGPPPRAITPTPCLWPRPQARPTLRVGPPWSLEPRSFALPKRSQAWTCQRAEEGPGRAQSQSRGARCPEPRPLPGARSRRSRTQVSPWQPAVSLVCAPSWGPACFTHKCAVLSTRHCSEISE